MLKNIGKKEKIELTITGIGVIFLIFLVITNVQEIQAKKKVMVKSEEEVVSSLAAPISFETLKEEESKIKEGWGRDPFVMGFSGTGEAGLEGLNLNGIVWDEDAPYAIINTDVVKVGDKIGGMLVVEITETSVVLEQDEKRHTLELFVF